MLRDVQTVLSDNQAVIATAFTANSYDVGNSSPLRNLGRKYMRVVCKCRTTTAAAGAATVQFDIGEADDAAGTNFTPFFSTAAIGKATLVGGYTVFDIPLPDTGARRFIMGRYTVATGPLTAGNFDMDLTIGSDHQRVYPDGYTQGA